MASKDNTDMETIIEILLKMALGNFDHSLLVPKKNDETASLMTAVNILMEELRSSPTHSNFAPDDKDMEPNALMFFSFDGQGKIMGINSPICTNLDKIREKLLNKPFVGLLSNSSQTKLEQTLEHLSQSDCPDTIKILLDFKGNNKPVHPKYCTLARFENPMHILLVTQYDAVFLEQKSKKPKYKLNYWDKQVIIKVREHLMSNLEGRRPTIKELAKITPFNEQKLKSGFKIVYGDSIASYYNKGKLRKTKALIEKTEIPIKTIILDMGYQSVTQFYNVFKAEYGMPPAQYRKYKKTPKYFHFNNF